MAFILKFGINEIVFICIELLSTKSNRRLFEHNHEHTQVCCLISKVEIVQASAKNSI